jgi:hypothetical protein
MAGTAPRIILQGHSSLVLTIAFSVDGKLVSGSEDCTIRLWDTTTGILIGKPIAAHSGPVTSVAFSADGTRIVSGSDDNTLKLWDIGPTGISTRIIGAHSSPVSSISIMLGKVRSKSTTDEVRWWDINTFQPVAAPTVEAAPLTPNRKYTPRRTFCFSDESPGWLTVNGEKVLWVPEAYRDHILAYSDEGYFVIAGKSGLWVINMTATNWWKGPEYLEEWHLD